MNIKPTPKYKEQKFPFYYIGQYIDVSIDRVYDLYYNYITKSYVARYNNSKSGVITCLCTHAHDSQYEGILEAYTLLQKELECIKAQCLHLSTITGDCVLSKKCCMILLGSSNCSYKSE
jgi:hypothetical protein